MAKPNRSRIPRFEDWLDPREPMCPWCGTKGGFAHLCPGHATAWDVLASKQNTTGKSGRKRLEKMFRAWVERPSMLGYGDDGITEI